MSPEEYCHTITQRSGSSFYYSFLFLKPLQRKAIEAIYAFAHLIDDIADKCSDLTIARQKLNWWSTEITRLANNKATHPVTKALAISRNHFYLPIIYFQQIIDGMNMDLNHNGFRNFKELKNYCYHVASTVGLLTVGLLSKNPEKLVSYAKNLGIALQLVNIVRDVGEDIRRDRIYLPQDELLAYNISYNDLRENNYSVEFIELMKIQTQRAREYYAKALKELPDEQWLEQRCGLIMAAIYFELLTEIENCNFQTLHQRIYLTPLRKLWISWKTMRKIKKQHSKYYG